MNLVELFGIPRKNGLAGLKYFNLNMPKLMYIIIV